MHCFLSSLLVCIDGHLTHPSQPHSNVTSSRRLPHSSWLEIISLLWTPTKSRPGPAGRASNPGKAKRIRVGKCDACETMPQNSFQNSCVQTYVKLKLQKTKQNKTHRGMQRAADIKLPTLDFVYTVDPWMTQRLGVENPHTTFHSPKL